MIMLLSLLLLLLVLLQHVSPTRMATNLNLCDSINTKYQTMRCNFSYLKIDVTA